MILKELTVMEGDISDAYMARVIIKVDQKTRKGGGCGGLGMCLSRGSPRACSRAASMSQDLPPRGMERGDIWASP